MRDANTADELAELALSLHEEDGFASTADRLLELAVKELDCASAGVILVHAKQRIETVAATHPVVAGLDALQLSCGRGPDLDVPGDPLGVVVTDAGTDDRWPEWSAGLAAAGFHSMLGTRLSTSARTIGSLNLYDAEAGRFDGDDLEVAGLLARHAAVALDNARTTDNLRRAIDSRHLIGLAQGILMERFSLDADDAFGVLRRYSQDGNVKLHTVAERVVASRRLPDET